jgi:PAS domain S-box-containing protein
MALKKDGAKQKTQQASDQTEESPKTKRVRKALSPSQKGKQAHLASFPELNPNPVLELDQKAGLEKESIRQRILIDQSRDGIVVLDNNGKVHETNLQFARMLGYSPEEVRGLSVRDWEYQFTHDQLMEMLHSVDEKGDHFETRHRRKDGTIYEVEISTNAAIFDGQKLIFCVCRDITERKRVEEALRASEERLKTTVNNAPIGIATSGADKRFLTANAAFCQALGYTENDLQKITFKDITYPADLGDSVKNMAELDAGIISCFRQEKRYIKKDGSIIVARVCVGLVRDPEGKPGLYIAELEDITERKKAEESLKESVVFNSALINNMPSPMFVTNNDSSIRLVNPAFEALTGFSSGELIGQKAPYPWWLEETKDESLEADIKRRSTAGNLTNVERQHRRKNGEPFWIILNTRWVKDGDTPLYRIVTWIDITERKKAEEDLRESEVFSATLLENAPNPIFVQNSDSSIKYVNPAWENLTGYSLKEVVGKKPPYPHWLEEEVDKNLAELQTSRDQKVFNLEKLFRKKNGERFWVELTHTLVKNLEGKPKYCVAEWVNKTERKAAEEKLKESEERYRTLFEKAVEGILITDSETRKFKYANPAICKMLGYSQEELTKMSVMDIHPEDSLTRAIAKFDARARGDISIALDMLFLKKDGAIVYADSAGAQAIIDGKACNIGFFTDATERKALEAKTVEMEALKRTNQAKSELLANVSHELRTPLTSIKGNIETLLETDVEWSKEQQLDLLQSANQQADRLTFLIRDLLDMSRIDSGKLTLDKRSYQVSEILDSISGVLSVITEKHQLKIANLPDLPPLQADKVRIGQIITNLVENAAKFSPEGSLIEIEAKLNAGNVIISVQDHGIGMPPEVVAKLFDRFYQSYQVVEGKTHGTGLGLSICKGIVEAHGGKIWVESQPDRGSKFSFSIPVIEDFKQGGIKGSPPL